VANRLSYGAAFSSCDIHFNIILPSAPESSEIFLPRNNKRKKHGDSVPCLLPFKAGAILVRENRFKFTMFSITTSDPEVCSFLTDWSSVCVFPEMNERRATSN
jgi:hypothetical protein